MCENACKWLYYAVMKIEEGVRILILRKSPVSVIFHNDVYFNCSELSIRKNLSSYSGC